MSLGLTSLAVLNRQAQQRAFDLTVLDGLPEVDPALPWMPDALAPLSFTRSFAALDKHQRLRANQLQALALTEKFIWFERHLIRSVNRVRNRAELAPPLAQALAHFVAEEGKHIAMFERLLQSAAPAWYATPSARLFRVSAPLRCAMALIAWFPRTLLVWVWLAALVEERTVLLARAYLRGAPGTLDARHRQVHALHLRDEVRHCQLDVHLLGACYSAEPAWNKRLAAAMLRIGLAASLRADAAAPQVVRQLGREFPRLQYKLLPRLLRQLRDLDRNPAYRGTLFGRAAMPRFHALLVDHPEHAGALALLAAGLAP